MLGANWLESSFAEKELDRDQAEHIPVMWKQGELGELLYM